MQLKEAMEKLAGSLLKMQAIKNMLKTYKPSSPQANFLNSKLKLLGDAKKLNKWNKDEDVLGWARDARGASSSSITTKVIHEPQQEMLANIRKDFNNLEGKNNPNSLLKQVGYNMNPAINVEMNNLKYPNKENMIKNRLAILAKAREQGFPINLDEEKNLVRQLDIEQRKNSIPLNRNSSYKAYKDRYGY